MGPFLVLLASFLLKNCVSAPAKNSIEEENFTQNSTDLGNFLDILLDAYYEEYLRKKILDDGLKRNKTGDIYEQMQGDQPASEINNTEYVHFRRGTNPDVEQEERKDRENWMELIKNKVLRQTGRENTTIPRVPEENLNIINITRLIPQFNNTIVNEDQIAEKIRSYYPSCDLPRHTDEELWKDENTMNLFFNIDNATEINSVNNIATATLRLYRLPPMNLSDAFDGDAANCENRSVTEDDKLLRISVYWYGRPLRKRKGVKRRLCDSKVVGENSRWVELNVRPAIRVWSKGGKNSGLAILVEDQDGNILKADRFFKGPSCTVGASTPKPIPTIIRDAARGEQEFGRLDGLIGKNSTSTLYSDLLLLSPIIDICTLIFPDNYTQPNQIGSLRINACSLRKFFDANQRREDRQRWERLASVGDLLESSTGRHIRHQRQHLGFDPRSRIEGQHILIRNEELRNLNISMINR